MNTRERNDWGITVALTLIRALAVMLVLWAFAARGKGEDTCYVRQDGTTQQVELLSAGHVRGLGGAHDTCVIGEDGVCYAIASECTPSHTENSYPKPGPNAGPLATRTWEFYHTDADADLHRCNVALVVGRDLNPAWEAGLWPPAPPPNGWPACKPITGHPDWFVSKVGCVPFTVASGQFNPRLFACDGSTPTPGRTFTPTRVFTGTRTPTPRRTPTKTPTPAGCCDPNIQPCPKGVPLCQTPSPTASRTPTAVPPTAKPTSTPAPPTPAPGRTVVPVTATGRTPVVLSPRPTASSAPASPTPTSTMTALPAASTPPSTGGGTKGRGCLGAAILVLGVIYVSIAKMFVR